MVTTGFCPECDVFGEFEQVGEYTHECQACCSTVDVRNIPHSMTPRMDWCGDAQCPKCQGYEFGPYP